MINEEDLINAGFEKNKKRTGLQYSKQLKSATLFIGDIETKFAIAKMKSENSTVVNYSIENLEQLNQFEKSHSK